MPRLESIGMGTIAWLPATVSQCAQKALLFMAGAFVPPIVAFSIIGMGTNAWMLVPFRRRSEGLGTPVPRAPVLGFRPTELFGTSAVLRKPQQLTPGAHPPAVTSLGTLAAQPGCCRV
jgi:hypothetical protein